MGYQLSSKSNLSRNTAKATSEIYNLGVTLSLKLCLEILYFSQSKLAKPRRIRPAISPDDKVIHLVYIKCCAHERYRKDGNIIQFYPARNQRCYYTAVFQGLLHSIAYPPISSPYWASQQYESLLNNNAFTLHTNFAA